MEILSSPAASATGGKSAKHTVDDLKKFCHILTYLKKIDPELHEAIENSCNAGLFSSKGFEGLVFIRPIGEARDKLVEMVYSDEIEEASNVLSSHVVLLGGKYASLDTLLAGGEMPNRNRKFLKIDSVKGKTITLKGGAVLEKDSEFRHFDNSKYPRMNRNLHCFVLKSGSLDKAEDGMARLTDFMRKRGSGSSTKRGGGFGSSNSSRSNLNEYIKNNYAKMLRGENRKGTKKDLFLKVVVAILNCLEKSHNDKYKKCVRHLDWSPLISYYILVQPHCTKTDNQCLSNDLIQECLKKGTKKAGSLKEQYQDHMAAAEKLCADDQRTPNTQLKTAADTCSAIKDAYAGKGCKLWCDQLRYSLGILTHSWSPRDLTEIDDYVKTCYSCNEQEKECTFENASNWGSTNNAGACIASGPLRFYKSQDFLYKPSMNPGQWDESLEDLSLDGEVATVAHRCAQFNKLQDTTIKGGSIAGGCDKAEDILKAIEKHCPEKLDEIKKECGMDGKHGEGERFDDDDDDY